MGTLALYPLQNYIIIGISDVSQEKNAKSAEWRYFIGNLCPQRAEPDGMSAQIRYISKEFILKMYLFFVFSEEMLKFAHS